MKNYEIANVNNALASLVDQKLTGRLKFKLLSMKDIGNLAPVIDFELVESE